MYLGSRTSLIARWYILWMSWWQAGLVITLSNLTKDDIQSIFSKALLPRWIVFSELEKVFRICCIQPYWSTRTRVVRIWFIRESSHNDRFSPFINGIWSKFWLGDLGLIGKCVLSMGTSCLVEKVDRMFNFLGQLSHMNLGTWTGGLVEPATEEGVALL